MKRANQDIENLREWDQVTEMFEIFFGIKKVIFDLLQMDEKIDIETPHRSLKVKDFVKAANSWEKNNATNRKTTHD
jgi:hypothetical protein